MRIKIVRIVVFVMFLVIAGDLFFVQVIQGDFFYNLSVNNRIRVVPVEAQRGRILDRNHVPLADSRQSFNVTIIPQDIQNSEDMFDYLSEVLRVKKQTLLQKFFQRKLTPFAPVIIAEDVDKETAMVLEENKFRYPGLYVQETFRREYPFREAGAHILGYVGKISEQRLEKFKDSEKYGYTPQSIVGVTGIEEYYDSYLMGEEGGQQIEVNSRGRQVRLLSIRESEPGQDITLTIDQKMQAAAQDALAERKGSIIIMDYDSGEIWAMVSSPSFDNNIFTDRRLNSRISEVSRNEDAPLLNRSIKGLYPPGSVFKIIVSMTGLETGKIKEPTSFFCPGAYRLGKRAFRCSHSHGTQNLFEAIAHSCNVYFYNVGLLLGPEPIYKYAQMFNLGEKTNIDLPSEEKGDIPNPAKRKQKKNLGWYKGDTLNFSIGQSDILITPIQLLRMVSTVAREGSELEPHLIKAIGGKEVIHLNISRNIHVSKGTYAIVKRGLWGAVHDPGGTARLLDINGFHVAGKTGTAQSVPGKDHHAWFVGYDDQGDKKFAFSVFLEYGGSSYNACLVAKELLTKLREQNLL